MTPLCCTQNSLIKCSLPGVHWLLYEQSRVKVQKALLSALILMPASTHRWMTRVWWSFLTILL